METQAELETLLGEMQASLAGKRVTREFDRLLAILGNVDSSGEMVALAMIALRNANAAYGTDMRNATER